MAVNPMQRKARGSFLLGMLITLIITGAIIALLVLQLLNQKKEENSEGAQPVYVYVLSQDVKSGEVIIFDETNPDASMVKKMKVRKDLVPGNATMDAAILNSWTMQDKQGNKVYIKGDDSDERGYKLYIDRDNNGYEVKKQEITEKYYIEKGGEEEFLELTNAPIVAKVDMKANTVLTSDLITSGDSMVQDDVRKQEYNIAVLPTDLETGDFVDIRLMLPNGQDFIVVSKKEVEIPNIAGADSIDTFWVNLSEDEILNMSCAIIDAAKAEGSKLYLNKYTDPGMQNAATPTYVASNETAKLLSTDSNILEKALKEIRERYNKKIDENSEIKYYDAVRGDIDSQVNSDTIDPGANVKQSQQESITNSKETRKEYVESLSMPATNTTASASAGTSTNTTAQK